MNKKLSKVLAVVLSLALVLGLAAVDTAAVGQAAKKLKFTKTGKKAVKSGEKRTLKITGTNAKKAKWTVTGSGKQYVKLAKKKGATNSFTVKENATGTVKVTAKLTKKNKVSKAYTLSCDLAGIAFATPEASVETGATVSLSVSGNPSNAAVPAIVYSVAADDKGTAVAEDVVVTAAAVATGVDFTASKAGTYYVTATAGDFTATAVVTVKDHVAVLKAVKQTKINELELAFDSDCTYITNTDDIKITNGVEVRRDVKSIAFDAKDKTKAIVTTIIDLNDGKENKVDYKGSVVSFPASNGEVANISLNIKEAPVKTAVPVKALFEDANGVIIKEVAYGDTSDDKFEITVEVNGEATEDQSSGSIKLSELTDSVKVNVVYHTGKTDEKTGDPIDVNASFTITAIAAGQITTYTEYTITTAINDDNDETKYTALKAEQKNIHSIKIDTNPQNAKELFVLVNDDLGYTRVDGSLTAAGYTLTPADDTYLQVNGDLLQGAREGKTSIIVSDETGNAVFTIPVEVLAAPQLKTISVDKSTITLSAGNYAAMNGRNGWKSTDANFKVICKDQYGDAYPSAVGTISYTDSTNNRQDYVTPDADGDTSEVSGVILLNVAVSDKLPAEKYDATTSPSSLEAGKSHTNAFVIEVEDTIFGTKMTKSAYVTVRQPKYGAIKDVKLEVAANVDTTLSGVDNGSNKCETVKVALYDTNGVFIAYDWMTTGDAITLSKGGKAKTVSTAAFASDKELGAIYTDGVAADDNKIDVVTFGYRGSVIEDGMTVATKAETGKYTIKVKGLALNAAAAKNAKQDDFENENSFVIFHQANAAESANITVADSQKVPTWTQIKKDASNADASALAEGLKVVCSDTNDAFKTYDPTAETPAPYKFDTVEKAFVTNDKGITFTKAAIYVPYPMGNEVIYCKNVVPATIAFVVE